MRHEQHSGTRRSGGRPDLMTTDAFLAFLRQSGVSLWTEEGQLRFQAPKGLLLAQHLRELRARKAEIMELLDRPQFFQDVPLGPRLADAPVPLVPGLVRHWNYIRTRQGGLSQRICYVALRIRGP